MARSNGPFGPPETWPPPRRDSLSTLPVSQPAAQWPTQPYADHGQPAQAGPAYHFPPAEPAAADYGYNQQQPYAHPQWSQPADPRGYGVASYLPADPPPFQQTAHHHQQGYADADVDYADEFYEDEEPRRGRRWILIAAALVGAIGVGGALAYTYRSLVAPNTRVPLVKAEPSSSVKVRPDQRGGKEFPGADKKLLNRPEGTPAVPPQRTEQEADAAEAVGGDERNVGAKPVKTIPIGSQPAAVAPSQVTAVPGITLQGFGSPPQAEAKAPPQPPATARMSTGQPAAPAAEAEDDDPPAQATAPPPTKRPQPVAPSPPPQKQQVALAVPSQPRPAPPAASSGLGYVVVLASKKTHMDAVKAYADVHEKHAQVLSGKTPDVQEADLGAKGVFYRAVVGPPVSREAATSLCSQLKAAGQDCWIKAF